MVFVTRLWCAVFSNKVERDASKISKAGPIMADFPTIFHQGTKEIPVLEYLMSLCWSAMESYCLKVPNFSLNKKPLFYIYFVAM